MSKDPSDYYLIKSGEILERANKYRQDYKVLHEELFAFVESLGCCRASVEKRIMKLRGIVFPPSVPVPVPEGWTKPDKYNLSRPKNTKANANALRYFTPSGGYVLQWHPKFQEFYAWLGCPTKYSYTHPGKGVSGTTGIGELVNPVDLYWYNDKSPMMLKVPDMEQAQDEADTDGRVLDDPKVLEWKVPKGCKKILPEKWKLMEAEYVHRQEKQLAALLLEKQNAQK
jgi:hypothetical protein